MGPAAGKRPGPAGSVRQGGQQAEQLPAFGLGQGVVDGLVAAVRVQLDRRPQRVAG
ncbi:hypothetical protein ACFQZ4_00135 [Catellatospora coxensis]